MKIIFLINSAYPNYAGGIETWLYNISERLCEEHDITIISTERKDLPVLFQNLNNKIKLEQAKTLKSKKLLTPFIKSYLTLLDFYFTTFQMASKLNKISSTEDVSYIIALDSLFCLKAGLLARLRNNKLKVISSIRGPHGKILAERFPFFSRKILCKERKLLNEADCVWANGFDTIDIYKKLGVYAKLMKNGIDYDRIEGFSLIQHETQENTHVKIVSIGTLLPIKGIYELIESVSLLIKEHHRNVRLVFVGKGEQILYKKFAEKHGVKESVSFIGHHANPNQILTGKAISACLSGGSGMSMAAIESMVSGKPIIAWDSPVYRQFNKHSQTMLLVEENNVLALTNGFLEILNNYEYFLGIAKNAKEESKNYDWPIICNDLIQNINDC